MGDSEPLTERLDPLRNAISESRRPCSKSAFSLRRWLLSRAWKGWSPPKQEPWPLDTADYWRENELPWPPGPVDRGKPRPEPDGGNFHA